MRLGVYSDFPYRRDSAGTYAEQPFALFAAGLADHVQRLTLIGRLDPQAGRHPYRLRDDVAFVALPHYPALSRPADAARAALGSLVRFWRALDELDALWLLGPHPLAIVFALAARARGRTVVLGVRQHLPAYAAHRHPADRRMLAAAVMLEALWRVLGRRLPVVVVGDGLARGYRHARRLLVIYVSIVRERDLVDAATRPSRASGGDLVALSVGRLDAEKNPLMLADVLSRLVACDARWRLVVCGDGPLAEPLTRRLRELEVDARADLRGHVPADAGLRELFHESDALLHVSWTEGLPQVLLEAFAARLAVVATAVGGVQAFAGDAALLVAPGDPDAAASALGRLGQDEQLRNRLATAGYERARAHTVEAETGRVAAFAAATVRVSRRGRRREL